MQGMTTYFISRHPGAVAWAQGQGLHIHQVLPHLDPHTVQPGDTVMGTLSLPVAAQVCARGARYLHLSLNLPLALRGQELSAEQLRACGAHLCEYRVEPVPRATPPTTPPRAP
jgi:CRISPR-associated protein Csx16